MRGFLILLVSAVMLGLAGGYAWSVMTAPSARTPKMKATTIAIPASPEERPATLDREWDARPADKRELAVEVDRPDPTLIERSVTYSGCNEVRAAGKAPIVAGQPGYRPDMDGDDDGIACEPARRF